MIPPKMESAALASKPGAKLASAQYAALTILANQLAAELQLAHKQSRTQG